MRHDRLKRRLGWLLVPVAALIAIPLGGVASGADGPTCFGQVATLAYPDNQFVVGTPGADVIVTDGQVQLIDAGGGNDLVCASGGNDIIGGGAGRDKIAGQGGNDNLGGGDGNDRLMGGSGRDLLNGHRGRADLCIGGSGVDLASPSKCEFIRGAATAL